MTESVLDQVTKFGGAQVTEQATWLKETIADAVEDGLRAARRTMKQGREFAEDGVEEAIHTVKNYPLQTVAVTFGVALATGAFLGWLMFRRK